MRKETPQVGDIVTREAADSLPAWSRVRRVDDPANRFELVALAPSERGRFRALTRLPTGLWLEDEPGHYYGGLGTALWEVLSPYE